MKLATYLSTKRIPHAVFAEKIGTTQAAVSRYVSGQRVPRPGVMARITAATEGKVTANDFMLPAPSQKESA